MTFNSLRYSCGCRRRACLLAVWAVVPLAASPLASASKPVAVVLTRDAVDESAGGLPAFKIETSAGTYYLEKSGAGLCSLVDRDGNDWISFHPSSGSGPGGEFRGFPNAVHKQSGSYFHPKNAGPKISPAPNGSTLPTDVLTGRCCS